MSFDIFVTGFAKGAVTSFDRAIVEQCFEALLGTREASGWRLKLPGWERIGAFLYVEDGDRIDGFSVNRPPDHPLFWNALFEVLQQTPSVLFWPNDEPKPGACVARAELASDMPVEMLESIGAPAVVASGEEIKKLICC